MSDFEAQLGIGDPTNPNPTGSRKPKAQVIKPTFEEELGINNTPRTDYQTSHDSNVKGFDHASKYEPDLMNAGQDQNEVRAANQGWGDKAANSLVKAAGLAGTGVIGTFTALPYGIGGMIDNLATKKKNGLPVDLQDFKPLIDNPVQQKLSEFNDALEKALPDYASQKERDASALSADNILTPNFLFDKIIKNAGFTVGAIGSGKIVGSMLNSASKLLASGVYGAEKMAELEALTAQGMQLPQALDKVAKTLRVTDHFNQAISSGIAAAGEAQFEGADAKKSMHEQLLNDFREKNHREPLDFELQDIDKRSTAAGVVDMAINLPILGLSDFLQFGNSLTKGFKAEVSSFSTSAAKRLEKGLGASLAEKSLSRLKTFGGGMITEASEEGSQTLTQKAAQDYFSRKHDLSAKDGIDDILNSTLHGVTELMGTKEGIESMLLGAITGVGSHVVTSGLSGELGKEWNKTDEEYQSTADLMSRMKEHAQKSGLMAKYEGAKRGQSIQESMNQAVEDGNIYDFQSLKNDRWKNMVQTYTQANKLDKLYKMIEDTSQLDETSFQQLFPDANLQNKSKGQYIKSLKDQTDKISSIWSNVQTRFPQASDDQKEQIWSSLVDAEDRLKREKQLDQKITGLAEGSTPTMIPTYQAVLLKHNGGKNQEDRNAARQEYRGLAENFINNNSASAFDISEVDEMFKLQDDREGLVNHYNLLKQGEGFIPAPKPQVTPKQNENKTQPNSTDSGETDVQPTDEGDGEEVNGDEIEGDDEVEVKDGEIHPTHKAMMNARIKGELEGVDKLTPEEKRLYKLSVVGSTAKNQATPEEEKYIKQVDDEFAQAKTGKTIDALKAKYAGEVGNKPKTFSVQEIADKIYNKEELTPEEEAFRHKNSNAINTNVGNRTRKDVENEFNKLFNKIWGTSPSTGLQRLINSKGELSMTKENALKVLADNQTDIDALPEVSLNPAIMTKIKDLRELIKKIKELAKGVVIKEPKAEFKATPNPLHPLRVINPLTSTKEGDVLSTEQKWIGDFYKQLNALVTPLDKVKGVTLMPTMDVVIKHDSKTNYFDIYADKKKIGYLSQIDAANEGDYPKEVIELNNQILAKAKDKGQIQLTINWKFGLNNKPTNERSLLSDSVFGKLELGSDIKIFRNIKPNNTNRSVVDMLSKEETIEAIEEEDVVSETNTNDNYYMVVKDPAGNVRRVGLTSAAASKQEVKSFLNMINQENPSLDELNKSFWLASNRIKGVDNYSTEFFKDSESNEIKIRVSGNRKADGSKAEQIGFIDIDRTKPIKTQEDLLNALSVRGKENIESITKYFGNTSMSTIFSTNLLRRELEAGNITMNDFNLSLDPQQPWHSSAVISGISSEDKPVVTSKGKAVKTPKAVVESATKPEEFDESGVNEDDRPASKFIFSIDEEEEDDEVAKAKARLEAKAAASTISSEDFKVSDTQTEVVKADFNKIRNKLKKILPSNIKLERLEELLGGMYKNDTLWGAFSKNIIYLNDSIGRGTEYHEAFHAIFRTVFNDAERARIYSLVQPLTDTSDSAVQSFKSSRREYANLTEDEAKLRILDEASADLFQSHMNDVESTNPILRKLRDLFNWLRNLMNFTKNNQESLDDIFTSIRKGKYVNRSLSGITNEISFKTLTGLSSGESRELVNTIIVNVFNQDIDVKDKQALKDLIQRIAETPGSTSLSEVYSKDLHSGSTEGYKLKNKNVFVKDVFADPDAIIQEVLSTIKNYGVQVDSEFMEEFQDDEDSRYKDIAFDDDPFETTMFGNLPEKIRNMLLSIGIQTSNGLFSPISVLGTYAQLKRILVGQETYAQMKAQIELYKSSNPELQAVFDSLNQRDNDENFQNVFRNTFSLEYADSMHISIDPNKREFAVFASNRQDETSILLERWKNAYERINSRENPANRKKLALNALKELKEIRKQVVGKKSEIDFTELQKAMYGVGIEVTGHFLETVIQGNQRLSVDDAYPFTGETSFYDDLSTILSFMESEGNPFKDSEGEGTLSRFRNIATADAKNRNDIFQTSFRNSNNKSIQAFIKPNFELVRAREVREGKLDLSTKVGNYIVDKFREKQGDSFDNKIQLTPSVFGGARSLANEEGVTAKMIDPKSKLYSMFIAYSEGFINPFVHESKSTEIMLNVGEVLGEKIKAQNGKSAGVRYDEFVNKKKVKGSTYATLNDLSLDSYKYMLNRDLNRIRQTASELEDTSIKHIEEFHFKVKGNKQAYINGKPNVLKLDQITQTDQIPNGLKITQFPMLQKRAEEIFKKQESKDWLSAVNEATRDNLDQFMQDEHQAMVSSLVTLLKDQGIDIEKDKAFIMGNRYSQFSSVEDFLSDFVAGNLIMIDSYAELIRGDEAKYMGPIDVTKRAAGLVANGTSINVPGDASMIMLADQFSSYDPGFEGVPTNDKNNDTDAMSYDSGGYRIKILKGLGKINAEEEAILLKRAKGLSLTKDELKAMSKIEGLNSLKLVGFDGKVYWKTSVVTLWPDLVYNKDDKGLYTKPKPGFEGLRQIYEQTKESGHDLVAFESAIKLGRADKQFPNSQGKYEFGAQNGITLDNRFIRLQVENPTGKMKITLGTQLMQLMDSELEETYTDKTGTHDVMLNVNGRQMSVKEVRADTQSILAELTSNAFELTNNMFDATIQKGDKVENLFTSMMAETAKASGGTDIEQQYYEQDGNGNRVLSPNIPSRISKEIQLLMAYYNKNVLSKKIPGMKLTLISPFGITKRNGEKLQIHKYINQDGVESIKHAECMISEEMIKEYGLRVKFDDKGHWDVYKGKVKLDSQQVGKILTMLGFRIPTQSHHSMLPFKVVGFLPSSYGSSIVVPAEVAHLAGSDYDVDSLFVNRKEFYIDDNNELHIYGESSDPKTQYKEWLKAIAKEKIVKSLLSKSAAYQNKEQKGDVLNEALKVLNLPSSYEEWSKTKPQSKYALTNRLLDNYMSFMLNPRNKESIFTPASMDSIGHAGKVINDTLYGISENSPHPYNFFGNLFSHWKNNKSDIVGPAANASKVGAFLTKNFTNLMKAIKIGGVEVTGYSSNYENDIDLVNKDGKVSIGSKVLRRRKADSLSSLVSAMTDNAKERLAVKLNLTPSTIAIFGNMLALGFGMNRTMLFANQPILRQLSKKIIDATAHINKEGSSFELVEDMMLELQDIIGEEETKKLKDFSDSDLLNSVTKENLDFIQSLVRDKSIDNDDITKEQLSLIKNQYLILKKYKELQDATKYFSAANRILNTNKGLGITPEDLDKLNEDLAMFAPTNEERAFDLPYVPTVQKNVEVALDDFRSVNQKLTKHFIPRTQPALNLMGVLSRFGKMNIKRTKSFKSGYIAELTMMGLNKSLKNSANPMFRGKTLKDFEYMLDGSNDSDSSKKWSEKSITEQYQYVNREFNKPNSVLSRNITFNSLVTKEPNETNPFYRLEFNTNMKTDAQYKEELINAMEELFKFGADHPISQFANNLFISLALRDALEYRSNSPISLIPPSRFKAISKNLEDVHKTLSAPNFKPEFEKMMGMRIGTFERNFLLKWLRIKSNRRGWKEISIPEDSAYLSSDEQSLTFNAAKMDAETFDAVFKESKMPMKSLKGQITWPMILNSGGTTWDERTNQRSYDDVLWVRSFLKNKNEVTYVKVDLEAFNPHHSPYSIPVDFETEKAIGKSVNDQYDEYDPSVEDEDESEVLEPTEDDDVESEVGGNDDEFDESQIDWSSKPNEESNDEFDESSVDENSRPPSKFNIPSVEVIDKKKKNC
jgi:hypothetical protein